MAPRGNSEWQASSHTCSATSRSRSSSSGLIASAIALAFKPQRTFAVVIEALFSYFLLFSIAVSYFYNFVFHVFFGEMAAAFIGWADSPFQLEVGFASLGFAVLGLLAFKGSRDMRIAVIVGPTCFLWGAAGGSRLPDGHAGQFCSGQRRYHALQRPLASDHWVAISVVAAPTANPRRCLTLRIALLVLEQKENIIERGPPDDLPLWKRDRSAAVFGDLAATLGLRVPLTDRPADRRPAR